MTQEPTSYGSPAAFRQALEERLRARAAREGRDLGRLRRLVSMDRMLARLFAQGDRSPWIVKGAYGLEVRFHLGGRSTRDLDLALPGVGSADLAGNPAPLLERALVRALEQDVSDHFRLEMSAAKQELGGAPDGGYRFHIRVDLDGRCFDELHLDVVLGEEVIGEPDWLTGPGLLDFAGIPAARFAMAPLAQHFAEKAHALTRSHGSYENTRVRDLVDVALMIESSLLDAEAVRTAIVKTFERGGTHTVPRSIPPPPANWEERYAVLSANTVVRARTVEAAQALLQDYWRALGFSASGGDPHP